MFSVTETAKKEGLTEGLKQGREEGEAIGRKAGIEEGKAIGLEKGEQKKALEIAIQLKQMGLPVTQITQATGLSAVEPEAVSAASES